jgi:hypothetical protein
LNISYDKKYVGADKELKSLCTVLDLEGKKTFSER